MKKIFIFGLFFLTLTTITCLAQSAGSSGDVFINQIYEHPDNNSEVSVISKNDVFLRQRGHLNTASILQSAGSNGANLAMIQQQGAYQQILLNQNGSNNRTNFKQSGRSNSIDVKQFGSNISSNIYQNGRDNYIQQELGRDNTKYNIIQHGNDWGVIDLGFTLDSPGYTVVQIGMVGVTMTIEQH